MHFCRKLGGMAEPQSRTVHSPNMGGGYVDVSKWIGKDEWWGGNSNLVAEGAVQGKEFGFGGNA